MNEAVAFLIWHGYAVLFLWVAVEELGLPVPSEPVRLATGALAGAGQLWLPLAHAWRQLGYPVEVEASEVAS